ncbi:hypothetical protein BpHYR1_023705 [Brachionus plicatilis]|uniref:Uncharacterized protein n=1 Tax=Brachionus plicatilis TaxID=10195 RepID=A0A3M7RTW8_BRAPC|nr:hypothetical protein BpHYR1_023705 [Brachionus plicatilis]
MNVFELYFTVINWGQGCILPASWSGTWSNQQQKLAFNDKASYIFNSATVSSKYESFQHKGRCINQKDERYFFYNRHEKCFKCLFVIQRHFNVIQFRETHCDEELTKFEDLCDMLTPDLPLLTMIRENSVPEKCPFTESYQIYSKSKRPPNQPSFGLIDVPEPKACITKPGSDIIARCSDNTMLRFNFQDCFGTNKESRRDFGAKNEEGMSAKCIAHWNEGNLNYLIVQENEQKKEDLILSKKFKCMVYKDLDRPFKNQNNNVLNPRNNLIQLSLSDDELCREFYTTSDGSNSFTLAKNSSNSATGDLKCKFPKIFNKKWSSLDQTKYLFKSHSKILKIKSSNRNHLKINSQADNLEHKFGCFFEKTISNFLIHLKYANYDPFTQQCLYKDIIYEDLFFVDSNIGVECPFSNRVYQLSSDKEQLIKKRSTLGKENQFSMVFDDDYNTEPECEHFLKIGCRSIDYTIFKKCKFNLDSEDHLRTRRNSNSPYSLKYFTHNIYFDSKLPIIESETNRLCLATWNIDGTNVPGETNDQVFVVLSKQLNSLNNSITCSVWETGNNHLKITDDYSLNSCLNRL